MLCLAIDASGQAGSVALVRDEELLYEAVLVRERSHAASLAPMVRQALAVCGLKMSDCDVIGCIVGPGSFTGVRIGVATAQGIAYAAGCPCAPVDALEALAAAQEGYDGWVCPILDARAGQVYAAAFCSGERMLPDEAAALEAYLAKLPPKAHFVGDGVPAYRERIRAAMGQGASFGRDVLRAGSAARLALARPETWCEAAALRPLYLRAPQAERERALREAKHENG